MTTEAKDGHYYHQKLDLLTSVSGAMNCAPAAPWPTHMDGEAGWGCQVRSYKQIYAFSMILKLPSLESLLKLSRDL